MSRKYLSFSFLLLPVDYSQHNFYTWIPLKVSFGELQIQKKMQDNMVFYHSKKPVWTLVKIIKLTLIDTYIHFLLHTHPFWRKSNQAQLQTEFLLTQPSCFSVAQGLSFIKHWLTGCKKQAQYQQVDSKTIFFILKYLLLKTLCKTIIV